MPKLVLFFVMLVCTMFSETTPKLIIDVLKRPVSITYPDGKTTDFTYDVSGNRTSMKDWHGTTTYSYDKFNNLIEVRFPSKDTVKYQYDVLGNITQITYPDNSVVRYEYDGDNRLSAITDSSGVSSYEYDNKRNLLTKQKLSNEITTEYTYDSAYRVTGICHKNDKGELIASFQYKFDGNNNRIQVVHKTPASVLTTDYKYDKLNRLVEASSSDGFFEKFTYDCRGNCLTKATPSKTVVYVYDDKDRLIKAGDTQFFYDDWGNLIKKVTPQQTSDYSYDILGHLVRYKDNKNEVLFEYDGNGTRIAKIVNGVRTTYIQSPFSLPFPIMEKSEHSVVKFTQGNSRLNRIENGKSYVYLYDSPGRNVSYLLDSRQKIINRYQYASFGAIHNAEIALQDDLSFAGEELDKETGLIFLRNRYYDPEIGRFISQDAKPGVLENPQTFNGYVYVRNNPINLVDPFGFDGEDPQYAIWYLKSHGVNPLHLGEFKHAMVVVKYEENEKPITHIYSFTKKSGMQDHLGDHSTLPNLVQVVFKVPIENAKAGEATLVIEGNKDYFLFSGPNSSDDVSNCDKVAITGTKIATSGEVFVQVPDGTFQPMDRDTLNWLLDTTNPLVGDMFPEGFEGTHNLTAIAMDFLRIFRFRPAGVDDPGLLTDNIRSFQAGLAAEYGAGFLEQKCIKYFPVDCMVNAGEYISGTAITTYAGLEQGLTYVGQGAEIVAKTVGKGFVKSMQIIGNEGLPLLELPKADTTSINFLESWHPGFLESGLFAPDIGGVALNKRAEMALNLADVVGAFWDEGTGQLVLFGRKNCTLPKVDLDDLAVAIKSLYGLNGEQAFPAVSIDFCDETDKMKVRYFGAMQNTSFGEIMFECDLLLKKLILGMDPETKKPFKSRVKGYKSLFDRYRENKYRGENYCRMWFVPQDITLIESDNKNEMLFDKVKMQLLTESTLTGQKIDNKYAEAFAKHFTEHFDSFAKEFPVLEKLKALGKVTALVKWIHDNNLCFDFLDYFKSYVPKKGVTPQFTAKCERRGTNGKVLVMGGIDYFLGEGNFFKEEGATPNDFSQNALLSRGSDNQFSWNFQSPLDGEEFVANAYSLQKSRKEGNVKKFFLDISVPLPKGNALTLCRVYNSFNDQKSALGIGWDIIPIKMSLAGEKLYDKTGQSFLSLVHLKTLEGEFFLQLADIDPVTYVNGPFCIQKNAEHSWSLLKNGKERVRFNGFGNVAKIICDDLEINYQYEGEKLLSISSGDECINIEWKDNHPVRASSSDMCVQYAYDAKGQLASVFSADSEDIYSYDENFRLIAIKDAENKIKFEAKYDDYNRAVFYREGQTSATCAYNLQEHSEKLCVNGKECEQKFDNHYRLVSSKDEFGEVKYKYDDNNNSVEVRDALTSKLYKYNTQGQLVYYKDAVGGEFFFKYTPKGEIASKTFPNGDYCSWGYNQNGKVSVTFQKGCFTFFEYDADEHLTSIINGKGQNTTRTYDGSERAVSVKNPSGYSVHRDFDDKGRVARIYDSGGYFINYTYYDNNQWHTITTPAGVLSYKYEGKDMSIVDRRGCVTQMTLDDEGQISSITDAEGKRFEYEVLKD